MAEENKKFTDTVEKLSAASDKLDRAAKKMSDTAGSLGGSAGAEKAEETERRDAQNNAYLETIANAMGGFDAKDLKAGSEEKKAGGIFGSIARALGGIGTGVGNIVGGFMKGIGKAAAFGPKFVIAMGSLGLGIAAFMGAIGVAAWAVSKTFPDIAEGLKAFKDIDGKNLKEVGLGMAALGVGLGAQGLGGAMASVGNLVTGIADGIGALFGVEGGEEALIKKMERFGKYKLDKSAIQNNAEAMIVYGKAMSIGAGAKVLTSIGTLAEGVFGGIGKMFGAVPPLESLKDFSKEKIDGEIVKNNAEAMVSYLGAMTLGAGASALTAIGSLGGAITSIFDGVSKMFGGKGFIETTLENLRKFSNATGVDIGAIKINAEALIYYMGAMTLGTGASVMGAVGSLGNAASSIFDGASKLFGGKGQLDTMLEGLEKMSALKGIDLATVKLNAEALISYSKAMLVGAGAGLGKAGGAVGNMVGNMADGLVNFFGGKDHNPLDDLKKFALIKITNEEVTQIKQNALGIQEYVTAISVMSKIPADFGDSAKKLFADFGSIFSKDKDPMDELAKFAKKDIDPKKVRTNVEALQEFAKLESLGAVKVNLTSFTEELLKSIPALEVAIMGGVVGKGWIASGTKVKGLASPEIKFKEASINISNIRASLGMKTDKPKPVGALTQKGFDKLESLPEVDGIKSSNKESGNILWSEKLTKSIDGLTTALMAAAGGGVNVNAPTNVSSTRNTSTSLVKTSPGPLVVAVAGVGME